MEESTDEVKIPWSPALVSAATQGSCWHRFSFSNLESDQISHQHGTPAKKHSYLQSSFHRHW